MDEALDFSRLGQFCYSLNAVLGCKCKHNMRQIKGLIKKKLHLWGVCFVKTNIIYLQAYNNLMPRA